MNIFLTIISSVLLFFLLICIPRVTLTLIYNGELCVYAKVLFIKLKLFPKEKKMPDPRNFTNKRYKKMLLKEEKKRLDKIKKAEEKKAKAAAKKEKKATSGKPKKKLSLSEILELSNLVCKLIAVFFVKFSKHLHLDIQKVHIIVSGEDAASTAITYGTVTQSVEYIRELLSNITNTNKKNKQDVYVGVDFVSGKSSFDVKISAHLRVWHVLDIAFGLAYKFVKEKFLKI